MCDSRGSGLTTARALGLTVYTPSLGPELWLGPEPVPRARLGGLLCIFSAIRRLRPKPQPRPTKRLGQGRTKGSVLRAQLIWRHSRSTASYRCIKYYYNN